MQESVSRYLGMSPDILEKAVWTVVVLLAFVALQRLLVAAFTRRFEDAERRYLGTKAISTLLGVVAILALLRIWLGGVTGLVSSIGIISAGLAVALHAPLTNLAGWLFLAVRRPFTIGDRFQIGEHAGDVIDLRLFAFSLVEIRNRVDADQSTGRILHIPNGTVFADTIANSTQGFDFIWDEIPVIVTFESDWRKAKAILSEIADRRTAIQSEEAEREVRRAARRYLIRHERLTPIVWTSVADIGVTLTLRVLTNPRRRRSAANAIWEDILEAFRQTDDIDFAYPTIRYYDNSSEGKPGRTGREPPAPPAD